MSCPNKLRSSANHCRNSHLVIPSVFFPELPEYDADNDWRQELFMTTDIYHPNDHVIGRHARFMIPPSFFQELHRVERERAINTTVIAIDSDQFQTESNGVIKRLEFTPGFIILAILFLAALVVILIISVS